MYVFVCANSAVREIRLGHQFSQENKFRVKESKVERERDSRANNLKPNATMEIEKFVAMWCTVEVCARDVCVSDACVYVCFISERERKISRYAKRERERKCKWVCAQERVSECCACLCVCVCERERKRERKCVCVCVREKDRERCCNWKQASENEKDLLWGCIKSL